MDTEALIAWAKDARGSYSLDSDTVALIDALTSALSHADSEAKKAWAEVHRQDDRATRAEAQRDVLRDRIQAVVLAWIVPGVNPAYHEAMKNNLYASWYPLYKAVHNLSKE